MKRSLSLASVALAVSLLAVGCGSSSPSEPEEPQSLSPNIAGTWSGQTAIFGVATNVTLAINQAQSDPGLTAVVALTGTVNLNNSSALPVTGTKQGNAWSVSGNSGATILTIHQTLSSSSQSTGDLTLQIGPPSNQGHVALNLVRS